MEMKIEVACDVCQYRYRVHPEKIGHILRCRRCETKFVAEEYREPNAPGAFWQSLGMACYWGKQISVTLLVCSFLAGLLWLTTVDPQEMSAAGSSSKQEPPTAVAASVNTIVYHDPLSAVSTKNSVKKVISGTHSFEPSVKEENITEQAVIQKNGLYVTINTPFIIESSQPFTLDELTGLPQSELSQRFAIKIKPLSPLSALQSLEARDLYSKNITMGARLSDVVNQICYTSTKPIISSERPVDSWDQLQPGQLVLAKDGPWWKVFLICKIENLRAYLRSPEEVPGAAKIVIYKARLDQLQLAHEGIDDLVHVNLALETGKPPSWELPMEPH